MEEFYSNVFWLMALQIIRRRYSFTLMNLMMKITLTKFFVLIEQQTKTVYDSLFYLSPMLRFLGV